MSRNDPDRVPVSKPTTNQSSDGSNTNNLNHHNKSDLDTDNSNSNLSPSNEPFKAKDTNTNKFPNPSSKPIKAKDPTTTLSLFHDLVDSVSDEKTINENGGVFAGVVRTFARV